MLVYTEEQEQLREMVGQVLAEHGGLARRRQLRDAGRLVDTELWDVLVDQGLSAILVPEEQGGLGLGMVEVAIVMEALGRHDASVPLLPTVMAGPILEDSSAVAEGAVVSLAWREHPRMADPRHCETVFDHGVLEGRKLAVPNAHSASHFVVSARKGRHDLGLYLVDRRDVPDDALEPRPSIDHRELHDLRLPAVPTRKLRGDGLDWLWPALDRGAIALSAELLGTMSRAFEMARSYLCEREQFGRKIGSFQALQHRAVDAFALITQARAVVLAAAQDPTPQNAALAKAWCSEAALHVCQEALQFHGGIGMTDEHDLGFLLKRARVAAEQLGNASHHRARWAELEGY